jgi:RNA polymerase sigma-B factor
VARSISYDDDEYELWRRFGEGDQRAREGLVGLYLPLARRMARRYAGVREPYDDLVQVASLGLLNAIDRYDPEAGTPFAGFARPTILGELKRHLRDKVWTVRVPRLLHDRLAKIEGAVEELAVESGRPPSVREIAARVGLHRDEVLEALQADRNRRAVSLDAPAPEEEDGSSRLETIGAEEAGYGLVEDRVAVSGALSGLGREAREALRMRFAEELTQREIAVRLGRSQMYVCRLLRRSLADLRAAATASEEAGTGRV